jgi:hypothetical protein
MGWIRRACLIARAPGAPSPKVEPEAEADLGSERSVHRAVIGTSLFLPLATVVAILLVGAAMTPALGLTAWMVVVPVRDRGGGRSSGPARIASGARASCFINAGSS